MNDDCPRGYVRIPAHCRKKSRSGRRRVVENNENNKDEIRLLKQAITETEALLKPTESGVKTLRDLGYESSEQILNEDPRVPLAAIIGYYNDFYSMANVVPAFFSFAHERMIAWRYKKRFTDPNQRYEYIKDRFAARKIAIPIAYKLAVLKATLATATATTSAVAP